MNFLEFAETRYATKRYNSHKPIQPDKIEQLRQSLRLTPSSINCQPWKFSFIQDRGVKSRLAAASMHNEHKINDAQLLIAFSVYDDLASFQDFVDLEWEKDMADWYNNAKTTMTEDQIKAWLKNQVYIALGFCMAACPILGLDATPMEGIEPDKYAEILGLAPIFRPVFAVCVGHRDDDDKNDPARSPKKRRALEKVIQNI